MAGIRVAIKPAANLRAIMEDLPSEMVLELDGPTPVAEVIRLAGIPSVMVYRIVSGQRVLNRFEIIEHETELHIIAPISGG